ncbi:MAG: SDR family oxidoreductase [Rhizobiales bacterium]|nr:SDR family oxidoreductase [Hyphomicrobiales bacterium]NRB12890.1 SDR family oxidoreductase [Hyphomicrobiales bacterium]
MEFGSYPSLQGRTILVTGGGSGIGASIVTRFAALGARVAFIDIDEEASHTLIKSIEKTNVDYSPLFRGVDIKNLDKLTSAIKELETEIGSFQVLVNNAANDTRHSIEDVTPETWRDALSVNLDHQFFAVQAVIKGMKKAGGGSIINMGSMSWRIGLDQLSAYVTAKSAIEGLTNGLARELGPDNIRVNCITPGFIKTERQVKLWLTPELEKIIYDGQCLKELIEPEYVANLVAFLASDDSRMCTSSVFAVNGGWI